MVEVTDKDEHSSVLWYGINYGNRKFQSTGSGHCFHNAAFSLQLTNGSNKLECYITLGQKGLPVTNTLAYWAYSKVREKINFVKMTKRKVGHGPIL
jgi:hypothetical protein